MTRGSSDEDLAALVAELVRALNDLQDELEPRPPGRLPTPGDLRRFASEVAIPGAILVLETNVRALRLLQRAIRLADGAEQVSEDQTELTHRARSVSEASLERLDATLAELQRVVEGRPDDDDEAAALLADARELRAEVQRRLRDATRGPAEANGETIEVENVTDDGDAAVDDATDSVRVDVDAELSSIKDELEEADSGADDVDERSVEPGDSDHSDSGAGEPNGSTDENGTPTDESDGPIDANSDDPDDADSDGR